MVSGMLSQAQNISEQNNEEEWVVKNLNDSVSIYAVHGTVVWGHEFGFLKVKGQCHKDYLYLSWSTYENGNINNFIGEEVNVVLSVDNKSYTIPAKFTHSYKLTPLTTVLVLIGGAIGDKTKEHLIGANSVIIKIEAPEEMDKKMDVKTDTFSITQLKVYSDKVEKHFENQ